MSYSVIYPIIGITTVLWRFANKSSTLHGVEQLIETKYLNVQNAIAVLASVTVCQCVVLLRRSIYSLFSLI